MQKETTQPPQRLTWNKPLVQEIYLDNEVSILLQSPPGDPFKDLNPLKDIKPPNPFDV